MLKNIAKLEIKIGERVYQFLCDNDSPTADLKEVFFQFQKFVGQIEDQVKAQQEIAKAKIEDPKVEPEKSDKIVEIPQG